MGRARARARGAARAAAGESLGPGLLQGGDVLLVRTPKSSAKPVDLAGPLAGDPDGLRDRAGRQRRAASRGTDNTPPFRFRRWMFAQSGTPESRRGDRRACSSTSPSTCGATSRAARPASSCSTCSSRCCTTRARSTIRTCRVQATRRALAATIKLVARRASEGRQRPVQLGNIAVTQRPLDGRVAHLEQPLRLRRLWVNDDRGERDESFRGVLLVRAATARRATASRTCRRGTPCWSRATCRFSSPASSPDPRSALLR